MKTKFWVQDRIDLLMLYLAQGMRQLDIAKVLGCTKNVIEKQIHDMRKDGIVVPTQRTGPRSGAGHPEWKGGRVLDKNGYMMVYMPDHPMARGKYVLEHRLVMSQHLGRLLEANEVVHHISKDKLDNRIENLQLFSTNADHLKHELTGKCPKWTEDGKRRIQEAVLKHHGKHHWRQESDDQQTPQSSDHPIE